MKWYALLVQKLDQYPTFGKDVNRVKLFFKACAQREASYIANGDIEGAEAFADAVATHIAFYANRFNNVWRNPFKWFGDPFKGERQLTRAFAVSWNLSDEFIKAMG